MHTLVKSSHSGFGRIGLILVLPFVILVIAYGAYKLFFVPDPVITGVDDFKILSAHKSVRLGSENVRSIDISIYQEGKEVNLLKDSPEMGEKVYTLEVKPRDIGLKDGRAIITVKAEAGILKKLQYDVETVIDTVPPTLEVVKAPFNVYRGSGGFAVLRASDEDSVFIKLVDKAQSGKDKTFKAFRVPSDTDVMTDSTGGDQEDSVENTGEGAGTAYYAFFPAPYDISDGSMFYAVASDSAGNQSIRAVPTTLKMKKYKSSRITIDDSFINRVVAPLLNETNISDGAAAFKKVNEEWRGQSVGHLIDISEKTEPGMLWDGRFLQLKNSKVMATYGDKRTYRYKGKDISKAVHLGYDLASHAKAPVQAANDGIVRFADNLGIYGYTVIVDHGLGLMSLYGHLSTIAVDEGKEVAKGQIIGKTGATGLAGGDHLHFGILMHGYEISPLYWWDSNWIRNNVLELTENNDSGH
jgi:murein DD-endopeptidase MepM/ murein hydrolase activator NlpD